MSYIDEIILQMPRTPFQFQNKNWDELMEDKLGDYWKDTDVERIIRETFKRAYKKGFRDGYGKAIRSIERIARREEEIDRAQIRDWILTPENIKFQILGLKVLLKVMELDNGIVNFFERMDIECYGRPNHDPMV